MGRKSRGTACLNGNTQASVDTLRHAGTYDVNASLVRHGWAAAYRNYSAEYGSLEDETKAGRKLA